MVAVCIEHSTSKKHKAQKQQTPHQKHGKKRKRTKKMIRQARMKEKSLARAIRHEQSRSTPAIRRLAFTREANAALVSCGSESVKHLSRRAVDTLQEVSERYLIERLGDAMAIAEHHGRQTTNASDLNLICKLKPLH